MVTCRTKYGGSAALIPPEESLVMEHLELTEPEQIGASASAMRRASVTAGVALALMAVLGGFAALRIIHPMISAGDATAVAQQVAASSSLFRIGIACLITVVALDVVVAIALFTVFARTDPVVAAMATGFRLVYAAVYLVAISQLVQAVGLLDEPAQALRAIDAYTSIWDVGLILFGVHLLLIGSLAYRSGYLPKVFGVLVLIAGLGYLADGLGTVLRGDHAVGLGRFTFVGEVALIFWLLISGRRHDFRDQGDPVTHRDLAPAQR